MKKIIISFLLIMFSYTLVGNILATTDALPKDALRMRVIANSNSSYDKKIKLKVKQGVEEELYDMLKNIKEVEKARTTVKNNTDIIDEKVRNILLKEHYPIGYKVKYGMNYFPKKEYKGVLYKEGYYESLVVTLGKGEGENFWCVMFPPLCTLEVSDIDNVEYKSLVKEMIKKYF